MIRVVQAGSALTPRQVIADAWIAVSEDGKIARLAGAPEPPPPGGQRIDLGDLVLAPGLIDIHVHGGNGISFDTEGEVETSIAEYGRWAAARGVTAFLCTIAAPTADELVQIIRRYVAAFEAGVMGGAEPLGLHLEGPFLSPDRGGAFPPAWLRPASVAETRAFLAAGGRWIRQMTIAPDDPASFEVAALVRRQGIIVAMGHTDLDCEAAARALRGDWTHVTHTFNAMRGFDHRSPGALGAVLSSDGVTAELIADAIHVHPAAMTILLRCLGVERVILVSDATAGAGLPDGEFRLAGQAVRLQQGRVTLPDGRLAGSAATLDQCVRNVRRLAGLRLEQAVQLASLNPARLLRLDGRIGSLAAGMDASLIALDDAGQVRWTMVRGEVVFSSL